MLYARLAEHGTGASAFRWRRGQIGFDPRAGYLSAPCRAAPRAPGAGARRVMTGPACDWR